MKQDILLESGTNELEIAVFKVGDSILGVNVAKIESIITYQPMTRIPNSNENVKGAINHRGKAIPVLDLIATLEENCPKKPNERLLILININNSDFAIEVSSVIGIRRISWVEIETPPSIINNDKSLITGIVKEENQLILMLDLEKILADICPSLALKESKELKGLEGKKLVVVEDSTFLLKIVNESFLKAGATVEKFSNGRDALDYLQTCSIEEIHCVITDIEMPIMDGLTLTKQIKSSGSLKRLPVVIFSSIANESLKHKILSVGANAQITKPEIDKLVDIVKTIK